MNWKAPPNDGKLWINKSMELQILLLCNWNCHACDQHSNMPGISYVKKSTMTMDQIGVFIEEMKENNAYIGRIRVMGGEPTLHPKFYDMLKLLRTELVKNNHVGQLEVITNGSKSEVINVCKEHIDKVRVSGEAAKQREHVANLAATPNSLGYAGKICSAPWHCGFSLNYYGYFPCSAGAGIARLHDIMKHQRLTLPLNGIKDWPELQELCNFCYHGLRQEHKVKCGTDLYQLNVPSEESWRSLGPWLNGKQPDWRVYGT